MPCSWARVSDDADRDPESQTEEATPKKLDDLRERGVVSKSPELTAAVSLGEFGATSFLARSDAPTLPVQIGRLLARPGEANSGRAAALSVVLVVVTALAVLATEKLRHPAAGSL